MAAKSAESSRNRKRFPERHKDDWQGPMIDYKEVDLLKKFLTPAGRIYSRKRAGTTAKEQKALQLAIKQARHMGLLPYVGS